jgi:Uma2 family endonuclease
MAVNSKTITLEEYRAISELPENADKLLELIRGEIVEKVPSFTPSMIASRISTYLNMYLLKNKIGYVTGEAGGYIMDEENVLIPDVGYISKERLPETPEREAPVPPDLAVEVKSPTEIASAI